MKAAKTRAKNAAKAKAHPKRGLARGSMVACCAAEALAASLRLSGRSVSDEDVLALYRHTASGPDAGACILATLEAAGEHGLAGVRLASFAPVDLDDPAAVILGLALPAPHAVAAGVDAWWSWGEPWPAWAFGDAVIEEAWTLTWGSR
ncbi:MAG: hypothetical protein J2P30_00150 [Actinobacteria bacterium]|nr:hypothetical protein [Actinomycetota bacterium]